MTNQQIQNICFGIIEHTKKGVDFWAQKLYIASTASDMTAFDLAFEKLEQSVSTLVRLVNGLATSKEGR